VRFPGQLGVQYNSEVLERTKSIELIIMELNFGIGLKGLREVEDRRSEIEGSGSEIRVPAVDNDIVCEE